MGLHFTIRLLVVGFLLMCILTPSAPALDESQFFGGIDENRHGGQPMQAKKSSLTTLSNEALCKLRDEIAALLNSRAETLRRELNQLTGGAVAHGVETNGAADGPKAPRRNCPEIPRRQTAIRGPGAELSLDG